jgi:hypothetical protein
VILHHALIDGGDVVAGVVVAHDAALGQELSGDDAGGCERREVVADAVAV